LSELDHLSGSDQLTGGGSADWFSDLESADSASRLVLAIL
ncbi:hypothetical protein Tco_0563023, partial [Tanacetum coccineum]